MRTVIGAIAAVVILVGFFTITEQLEGRATAYYASALHRDHVTEEVSVGGKNYVVADGLVLEDGMRVDGSKRFAALLLAYEKAAVRRSPILALPGVEIEGMRKAVRDLAEVQGALADLDTTESGLIRSYLYPVHFLVAATDAEETRRAFLATGSTEDAHAYERALTLALAAYRDALSGFRLAFVKTVPEAVANYATVQYQVSREGTLRELDTLSRIVQEEERAHKKRLRCFSGRTEACGAAVIALPIPAGPDNTSDAQPATTEGVWALYESAGFTFNSTVQYELSGNTCAQRNSTPRFALLTAPRGTGAYPIPVYLNDISFIDSREYSDVPYYAYFLERDIPFVYFNDFSFYNCPTFVDDFSKVYWLGKVRDYASEHDGPPSLTGALVREYEAVTHLADRLRQKDLPAEEQDGLMELSLAYTFRTSSFEHLVQSVADGMRINIRLAADGVATELSPPYLFYTRNALPTLFLAFRDPRSRGVLREEVVPSAVRRPQRLYSQLMHTSALSELTDNLRFFRELHQY